MLAAVLLAPAGARAKIQEVVPVDASDVDFGDPGVRFMAMPGFKEVTLSKT
jgi:hypothetical protein